MFKTGEKVQRFRACPGIDRVFPRSEFDSIYGFAPLVYARE